MAQQWPPPQHRRRVGSWLTFPTTATTVFGIDTSTNTVVATVGVGLWPDDVVVNPAGTRAYVANEFSHDVWVIDTSTNRPIATVEVGGMPSGVAVTPDGTPCLCDELWQHHRLRHRYSNNTVVATVEGMLFPFDVAVKPDGTRVYATNSGYPTVSVIDTSTNTIVATVPVAGVPSWCGGQPNWYTGLRRDKRQQSCFGYR